MIERLSFSRLGQIFDVSARGSPCSELGETLANIPAMNRFWTSAVMMCVVACGGTSSGQCGDVCRSSRHDCARSRRPDDAQRAAAADALESARANPIERVGCAGGCSGQNDSEARQLSYRGFDAEQSSSSLTKARVFALPAPPSASVQTMLPGVCFFAMRHWPVALTA